MRAVDNGWNIGEDEAVFSIDNTPPNVNISNPNHTTYFVNLIDINVTIQENNSNISHIIAEIDGLTNITLLEYPSGDLYYKLNQNFEDGVHSIRIYAFNMVGLVNDTETITFTVNTNPPQLPNNIPGFDFILIIISSLGIAFILLRKTNKKL